MQRRSIAPRPDWQKRVEAQGCVWHGADTGETYWAEGTFYALTDAEIDRIAAVSEELHQMFIAAGDRVIAHNLFSRFGIPDWCVPLIRDAVLRRFPDLSDKGQLNCQVAVSDRRGSVWCQFIADAPASARH